MTMAGSPTLSATTGAMAASASTLQETRICVVRVAASTVPSSRRALMRGGASERNREAGIHGQDMAVDIGCGIAGEKDRGAGDLVRLAPAAERDVFLDKALHLGIARHRRIGLGGEEAGCDAVDENAMGS